MTIISKKCAYAMGVLLMCGVPRLAFGQDEAQAAGSSPLDEGAYVAPMASYIATDGPQTADGFGGVLAGGYRLGWYAFEFKGIYSSIDADTGTVDATGGSVGALLYPFDSLPRLFGIVEVGGLSVENYPARDAAQPLLRQKNIHTVTAALGAGYLFPIGWGRYDFALRAEALYRYGRRDQDVTPGGDIEAPNDFGDILVNVGLHLPLGLAPAPAPAPEPVAVVPVETPPDTDGDGVADSLDQCPDTPAGTLVNDVGCPLPPPTPTPPPCKSPEPGQRVDLSGCATGDVVVLRGVTFEFDKAALTPDAEAILDGVAESLLAAAAIKVEIGGHTDSKGSDQYNQNLSRQRAESVKAYLVERGVADERLTGRGYGESRPVADNETEEGRELNRRVELTVSAPAAEPAVEPAVEPAAEPAAEPAPATAG